MHALPLLLAFLFFGGARPQTPPADQPLPKVDELVKRFIDRSFQEEKQNATERYGFVRRSVRDELDADGKLKKRTDVTWQTLLVDGLRIERQIGNNGLPLTVEEQRAVAERERKQLDEARKKSGKKPHDYSDDIKVDDRLLSHFHFDLIGMDMLNGRRAYAITVTPQASAYNARNNVEKVVTHMGGTVWIDVEDYSFVKCDLHLMASTSFYGFLGALRQLDLFLMRRQVEQGIWLLERSDIAADARKLFSNMHFRQQNDFSAYRKLPNEATQATKSAP